MILAPLSPKLLVAAASALSGLRDEHPPTGDIALLNHWGFWSQYDHATEASRWPFSGIATAELLGIFAEREGLLRCTPEAGDVFLQFSPARGAFVRGGVVAHVHGGRPPDGDYWDIVAIEGSSGAHGELGGPKAQRVVRRLSAAKGDRFIRWSGAAMDGGTGRASR